MSRFFHYDEKSGGVIEGHAPVARKSAKWPMDPCCASGVNPDQTGELRAFFEKHGETVDIVDGDPVYESPGQRKRLLKLRGIVDKASF